MFQPQPSPYPSTPQPPLGSGWYPDQAGPVGQQYWDGQRWIASSAQPVTPFPVQEKSSGVALILTILWPGGGHLYLGLTKKGMPHVVANAIGLALGLLTLFLLPITVLIWVVTLLMTVGSVSEDTYLVNDALRRGQRIVG